MVDPDFMLKLISKIFKKKSDLIQNMENREFFEIENAVQITKDLYPEDSLSSITSMVTGENYNTHGIVGHSWQATDCKILNFYLIFLN